MNLALKGLKDTDLKLKEVREKILDEKLQKQILVSYFTTLLYQKKQEFTMSLKKISELKDEKRRKVMNLSVNLNTGKENISASRCKMKTSKCKRN